MSTNKTNYLAQGGTLPAGASRFWEDTIEGLSGSTTYDEKGFFEFRLNEIWNGTVWNPYTGTQVWDDVLSLTGINAGETFGIYANPDSGNNGYINLFNDSIVTGGGDVDLSAKGYITSSTGSVIEANFLNVYAEGGIKLTTKVNRLAAWNWNSGDGTPLGTNPGDIDINNLLTTDLFLDNIWNMNNTVTLSSKGKIISNAGKLIFCKFLDISAIGGINVATMIQQLAATNVGGNILVDNILPNVTDPFNKTGDLLLHDIMNIGNDIAIATTGNLTSKAGTYIQGKALGLY